MELYVHVEFCEALLEDFLRQLQGPNLVLEQAVQGLLLACESLLTYAVQLEALVPAGYPRVSVQLRSVIDCICEVAVTRASN